MVDLVGSNQSLNGLHISQINLGVKSLVNKGLLNTVEDNSWTISRVVGHALDVAHETVLRTLRKDQMHPYHLEKVQTMTSEDYLPFAYWYLQ